MKRRIVRLKITKRTRPKPNLAAIRWAMENRGRDVK